MGEGLRATEASLFSHMSILVTQRGANLRAYHFLRNQEILGFRKSERITFLDVKEVVYHIVEWKWVSPAPFSRYEKYFSSKSLDLNLVVDDFKGRKRLKALWEVTGSAVAQSSWSEMRTKEQYLNTLAVFWSMTAPVLTPSLPGIGTNPTHLGGSWTNIMALAVGRFRTCICMVDALTR